MRIATWNVNSLKVRLPHVLQWLASHQPDALCLQETKLEDEFFPRAEIEAAGYQVLCCGQKTYNGVAILSRTTGAEVLNELPGFDTPQKRLIAATVNDVRVVCVYVPNGEKVTSDKYQYKLAWLAALRTWLESELQRYPKLALLGDFNIAPEDRDSWDPEGLRETIHHTSAERRQFRELLELGLTDAYRLFEQPPKSYSWWDYRMLGFQKNRGLRIDHVLVSAALKPSVTACAIDRAPRKLAKPSDHAPVVATLDL